MAAAISASEIYRSASRLLLYAARLPELPMEPLFARALRDDKAALWPRVRGDDLEFAACDASDLVPGRFGLLEPPESREKSWQNS